jgi:CDP-4-dehydro-6-deoxyglucose reductase
VIAWGPLIVPVTLVHVRDVQRATPRTRLLRLELGESGFRFAAGQAVMAGLHGSPLRKPYSIASAPREAERTRYIELLVQIDNSGGPDPHLELATNGTPLDLEGPFGTFTLPPLGPGGRLLLVAGGTGIAPLRSMLIEALSGDDPPAVHMVYSARSVDELAYREELEELERDGLIELTLTVTREEGAWPGRRGRIDRALLATAIITPETWCLVCGPPALVADVRSALAAIGVPDTHVGVERYDA